MKAVYIKEFGGPENLELREMSDPPKPQNTQILLRVKAAGVNRADLLQVNGNYAPPPGYSPSIPGLEFAGEIAEIGLNVSNYSVGDRVFGITSGEAQAEFVVIEQSLLARIPDNLTFAEAAAVPEVFVTAHDALFTQAGLSKGESLLIHAVGSGVGLAGLQLAKATGCRVFGTSRTQDKLDRCGEFGLDVPIVAATNPRFSEIVKENSAGNGVNVILDLVGGSYFDENLASLGLKGRLMLVGLTGGRSARFDLGIALHKRITIKGTVLRARPTEEKAEAMRGFENNVVPLLATGAVRPNLDTVFPAADAVEAYQYLASNESFGKVVLDFDA
jgi:putative PIG3 family NAD(P)H quinone oxidoreductase